MVGGCCAGTNSAGKATKNPMNCVKIGVDIVDRRICSTVETAKEAVLAAGFLQVNPKLFASWLVFDNFSKGICYAASQINKALADYDTAPVPMGFAGVGAYKPELKALRAVVKGK